MKPPKGQLDDTVYVVEAQCTAIKKVETHFAVYARGFPWGMSFQITSSRYPNTGANELIFSKWYKMTLRFYPASRKTGDTPRAQVSFSLPMDTPPGTYEQWPDTTTWTSRKGDEESKRPTGPSQHRGASKDGPFKRDWQDEATGTSTAGAVAEPARASAGDQAKEQAPPAGELPYTGVVCYQENRNSYVYSESFEREAVFHDSTNSLQLGEWINFYAAESDQPVVERYEKTEPQFRTIPLDRSVAIECTIVLSTYKAATRLVQSAFGPVLDAYGLVGEGRRGSRDATIAYVYEGGENGYWRLDYVHPE